MFANTPEKIRKRCDDLRLYIIINKSLVQFDISMQDCHLPRFIEVEPMSGTAFICSEFCMEASTCRREFFQTPHC